MSWLRLPLPVVWAVLALLLVSLTTSDLANAAPVWGEPFWLQQPDGTPVEVRIWGDEYYRVVESLDGYTLTPDPQTGTICYADLSTDGQELVSTGVPVGTAPPRTLNLSPHTRLAPQKVRQIVTAIRDRELQYEQDQLSALGFGPGERPDPPSTGNVVGLCLLIDFSDETGTISSTVVDNYCNQVGYSGNGNNGSVRDYFFDVSNGTLVYTNWVPGSYYRADNPKSYYDDCDAPYGSRARELVLEALNDLESSGFDFSQYDSNGDALIDAVNVLYAGSRGCGWAQGLWPHQGYVLFSADGVTANKYQMTDMGTSLTLSTFCHENGHLICYWPDLYDYDQDSYGVGRFCLMCYSGSSTNPVQPCAYLKTKARWATPIMLAVPQSGLAAPAIGNVVYKFAHPTLANEYYMIENRSRTGRDQAMPDAGLAIWHIDENGKNSYQQQTPANHYLVTLVQADGNWDMEHQVNAGDATDLFGAPSDRLCTMCTDPNTDWWDGSESGLMVTDISNVSPSMTFSFGSANEPPVAVCRQLIEHPGTGCCITVDVADIDGGSSDPNGASDIAALCITEVDGNPVGCQQSVEICGTGGHTVTLTITDYCGASASCAAAVTVTNTPPVAQCRAFSGFAGESCCITVNVADIDDGSRDPDGPDDIASLCITELDGRPVACAGRVEVCGVGEHRAELTITDLCGETSSCLASVSVVDNTPPDLAVALSRHELWPPNHKMVDLSAQIAVDDNCDADPLVQLWLISSSEPDNGCCDGDFPDDIQVPCGPFPGVFPCETNRFRLRAERCGRGDGRLYTVVYRATDDAGNQADFISEVVVPHDQGGRAIGSAGFNSSGDDFATGATTFSLVIAGTADAPFIPNEGVYVSRAQVGNHLGVIDPGARSLVDVDGDAILDLEVVYDMAAAAALRGGGPTERALSLRYSLPDGAFYLVDDIFALGPPLAGSPSAVPVGAGTAAVVFQPQPNPFVQSTEMEYTVGDAGGAAVDISIFNVVGQRVRTLYGGMQAAGRYRTVWDGRSDRGVRAPAGVYFYHVRVGGQSVVRQVALLN